MLRGVRKWLKPSFRNYTLTLVLFYLLLVFVFHSNLDPSEAGALSDDERDSAKILGYAKHSLQELDTQRNGAYDVIEGRGERPGVRVNPDGRAARYLREYHANYVNPVDRTYHESDTRRLRAQLNETCTGTATAEENKFIQVAPDLHVYSVFWDPRFNDFDNNEAGVQLRIMTVIQSKVARTKPPFYCIFENATHPWIAVRATYYEMCENHGRHYGGFILSCEVPPELYGSNKKQALCSVRVSYKPVPTDDVLVQDFKVVNTAAQEERHDFSICVAPLYGDIAHNQLIEFMELSSILGADHVTFYDFNIAADATSLLNYYEQLGRVSVIPWKLPAVIDKGIWYHGQLVSILDCLYRNMASTKYLSFNDLDEFLMPYNYPDWTSMMLQLDSDDKCGFQFNSVFIDPNRQAPYEGPDKYQPLTTLTNTIRTISESRIRTKCLVKPQLLFEPGIHHISKPILSHLQTIRMDLPDALLHHHRVCQPNFGMNCADLIHDDIVPSRYAEELQRRFSNVTDTYDSLFYGSR